MPTGPSDNSFGEGSKENDTTVTIVDGTVPPNKNDLLRSYLATQKVGTNTFIYLSWVRFTGTGDAHVDFELNKEAQPFDATTMGNVNLNRTVGDLLITYDFGGSGEPTIRSFTWDGNTWGLPVNLYGLGFAEAAVNTSLINDPIAGLPIGAGNFGEASVNLSLIPGGGFEPGECGSFGSVYVKARTSGESEQASLKDFIAPAPIHLANCTGTIEVKKQLVPANNPGRFDLTIGDTTFNNGGAGIWRRRNAPVRRPSRSATMRSPRPRTPARMGRCTPRPTAAPWNGAPLASGTGTSVPTGVTLVNNLDAIVCTFTNTFVKQPSTTATTSSPDGRQCGAGHLGRPTPRRSRRSRAARRRPGRSTSSSASRRRSRPVAVKAPRGTKIGATKTLSGGAATSDATTNTTAIGKYCWRAEYSGDAFYNGSIAHQRDHGVLHDREAALDDGDDVDARRAAVWFRGRR